MIKFTTIEEMEDKLAKVKALTNEIIDIMNVQFPIEENHFNHLSIHKFNECIKSSQDWLGRVEEDLNDYKRVHL